MEAQVPEEPLRQLFTQQRSLSLRGRGEEGTLAPGCWGWKRSEPQRRSLAQPVPQEAVPPAQPQGWAAARSGMSCCVDAGEAGSWLLPQFPFLNLFICL